MRPATQKASINGPYGTERIDFRVRSPFCCAQTGARVVPLTVVLKSPRLKPNLRPGGHDSQSDLVHGRLDCSATEHRSLALCSGSIVSLRIMAEPSSAPVVDDTGSLILPSAANPTGVVAPPAPADLRNPTSSGLSKSLGERCHRRLRMSSTLLVFNRTTLTSSAKTRSRAGRRPTECVVFCVGTSASTARL